MQAFVGPLGAISGFLVWTVFSLRPGGGIREAWDGTPYWTIGLPLLFLLHAAFGAAQRRNAWRAPLWTVAGHFLAVILVSRAGTGFGLLPLAVLFIGLPMYGVLGLAGLFGSALAAMLRRQH